MGTSKTQRCDPFPSVAFQTRNIVAVPLISPVCAYVQIFKQRIGSLRKALRNKADFFFVDAPFLASSPNTGVLVTEEDASGTQNRAVAAASGRSWWCWEDEPPGTRPSRAARYIGWEESHAVIKAAILEHAPIDGLLGFSQGSTAAALFGAEQRYDQQRNSLRFLILISGFLPRDPDRAEVLINQRPIGLPTMHVVGKQDALVTQDRSYDLWECFEGDRRVVYGHEGGHGVPTCSGKFKAAMQEFLERQIVSDGQMILPNR